MMDRESEIFSQNYDDAWSTLKWASEQSRFYLELRFKYTNFYVSLFTIIIGAAIGGIVNFTDSEKIWIMLLIPITIIILSHVGKKMVNGYFRRFLYYIVIIAKIEEFIFGNDNKNALPNRLKEFGGFSIFPNDSQFLPAITLNDCKAYNSSAEYINAMTRNKSSNKVTTSTFSVFQLLSILLSIAILYLLFFTK